MKTYKAMYKCRLCGEVFHPYGELEIEMKPKEFYGFTNKTHYCEDGSAGMADFLGFKMEEE